MATCTFTLLLLVACCVGYFVAHVQARNESTNATNENITTTMDPDTDLLPPPMVKQLDGSLEDPKKKFEDTKQGNMSASSANNSVTDTQPPPPLKGLGTKLSDVAPKLGKLCAVDKRGAHVLDFLTCGIKSIKKVEAMLDQMYCLHGQKVPRDCQDARFGGLDRSGVYKISPDGGKQLHVYCEQDLDGGGWTVFQRRLDGSVDFYRGWAEYKQGFGSVGGEHWLGNENLHLLTANGAKLKVELQYGTETAYADYKDFTVGNESQKYKMELSGYSGSAGDSLAKHSGQKFSTKDQDNDIYATRDCAKVFSGAWWYNACYDSNLNGVYGSNTYKGIIWKAWKGTKKSLQGVRLMVKPK